MNGGGDQSESSFCSEDETEVSGNNSCVEYEAECVRSRRKRDTKPKRSGKEEKLTSYVLYPQKWPHSQLKFHLVGKEKKYDELTVAEFCAGYMSILKKCKSSKEHRIEHLEELMYHATTKPWKSVLNYHAACVLEIERGNLKWGDNFQLHGLQSTTLNVGTFPQRTNNQMFHGKSGAASGAASDERVWFCRNYQQGNCSHENDHYGKLFGEREFLRHICAKCWLIAKKQLKHSERSDLCPLLKTEL